MTTTAVEPFPGLPAAWKGAAPVFTAVDAWWGQVLPAAGRLAAWALLCAAFSLAVYRLLAPRRRIRKARVEAAEARRRLAVYDGELVGALPLMRAHIGAALRLFVMVLPAGAAAIAPVLLLTAWLDRAYGGSWELTFFAVFFAASVALRRVVHID